MKALPCVFIWQLLVQMMASKAQTLITGLLSTTQNLLTTQLCRRLLLASLLLALMVGVIW
jgi:hypothetical protein